ncbi:MAG TPA: hypothetical protein VIL35_03015, partial [Vicinamibacterales bacterium]
YNIFEVYVQDSWRATDRLTLEGGLRLSYMGAWHERESVGMAVFDPARYDPNAPASEFPGLTWTARDPSIPTSGIDVKSLFWAPRVGAAYDLFGTGRTLLRGGFGVFNFHDPQGPYSGFIDLPYGVTSTVASNIRLAEVPGISPNTQPSVSGALLITDDLQPRTRSWSFTVQQRLPFQMLLEAGYVGNKSDRQLTTTDTAQINTVPFGAMLNDPEGDPNDYRPLRQYGDLPVFRHSLYQNYHALQTLLSRASSRFSYTVAYTWSKALGIRGGGAGAQGQVAVLPDDIRGTAYGVLGYDRTHVLNVGYSYLLPDLENRPLWQRALLGGWQVTGVSTWISGAPLQPLASTGANFGVSGTLENGEEISGPRVIGTNAVAVMPVLTCDPREGVSGDQYVNPNCFALPAPGTNGHYIFPTLRGPGYTNHDFALFKNFNFANGRKFQFRASLTNVFNHPQRFFDDNVALNLDYTNGVMTNSQFGILPRDNKYGRRIVQLAFKYYF